MAQTELEGVLASLSGESLNRLAELVAAKLTKANPASGRNSAVERLLPKQDVTGSNPAARSIHRRRQACSPNISVSTLLNR